MVEDRQPSVALVQPTIFPEAGRVDIFEYSKALAEEGVRVHAVVCQKAKTGLLPAGLTVHELNLPTRRGPMSIARFVIRSSRLIRTLRAQEGLGLVHLFNPSPSTFLLGVLLRFDPDRPKIVYDVRTGGLGRKLDAAVINWMARAAARLADGIIVLSASLAERLYPHPHRPPAIVPLGVNTQTFHVCGPRSRANTFSFIYVGTLHVNRQLINMLEAFSLVHDEHPCTRLIIAGDGNDRARLEQWVRVRNLQRAISFVGKVEYADVATLLEGAECGLAYVPITPWYQPQQQLKMLEYLASNLPTVATATEANAAVWSGLPPAMLTDDSPQGFANGMRYVLKHIETLRRVDFRHVAIGYDWRTITKQRLLPFYHTIIGWTGRTTAVDQRTHMNGDLATPPPS